LVGWSRKLREEHAVSEEVIIGTSSLADAASAAFQATIARLKDRKKRRALLGDRKSAVAQNRMKSIASLASDSPATKKRKRGGDGEGGVRLSPWLMNV
jgi:actin-related protein 5